MHRLKTKIYRLGPNFSGINYLLMAWNMEYVVQYGIGHEMSEKTWAWPQSAKKPKISFHSEYAFVNVDVLFIGICWIFSSTVKYPFSFVIWLKNRNSICDYTFLAFIYTSKFRYINENYCWGKFRWAQIIRSASEFISLLIYKWIH